MGRRASAVVVLRGAGVVLSPSLARCLLMLAVLVYRLLGEERALVAAVGDTYLDFAKRRARLVPFVW